MDLITQILVEYHIHTTIISEYNSAELHNLLHRRFDGNKSSIHSEQLEDKITKLERRHEPLNHQTPWSYTPQQNLCQKLISTICTGHSHPYEHCFVDLDASRLYSKETYRARVSYAIAYQVYNLIKF
jgi:hypothetical protein